MPGQPIAPGLCNEKGIVVLVNTYNRFLRKILISVIFYLGPYIPEDNIPTGQVPEQPIPPGLCDEILPFVILTY